MQGEADLVRSRLARGCRCYAVIIAGEIAGYGWLSTGPEWISELQLEILPRKAEGYIWNCTTLPEHRRKGVFKALVVGISAAARGIGITRAWIGTMAIPGESAVPQSGFRPALRFSTWRLGPAHVLRSTAPQDADPQLIRETALGKSQAPHLPSRWHRELLFARQVQTFEFMSVA
jgi:GNAT superfamily N-acetyltransferase